ncbi:molybdopterin molybdenumtransferase MoeA [Hypericibacter adhaerens]|jgi:molybdopterin molybdotransferase|uniref:Molybdopterin molybdenumtransferase n=1 Tax=Hypericibacter adhaerens TaxID=2602016 RepID=A0A5J6MX55_9PROT|nr:gephyrin-like molybdotransferase Glp [Hypericibacter adhaerens]QEX22312.1 molybdopterin molybdenumtransferase MoeA [Hypericibacter adhaerens]
MIPVEQAQKQICAAFRPLPAEQVGLAEALGRVLAEEVTARVSHPPFAVSAMDGYAVRAADVATVPVRLKLVGTAPAGGHYEGRVGPGEAVRILTGGPLPEGADSIVIQENARRDGDSVELTAAAEPGRHIRPQGQDFEAGKPIFRAGTRMTVRDIGLAAAANRPWLKVRRRPRVAILSTGDELSMPGEPLGPAGIVGSNGLALSAFVRACGGEPVDLGIARDDSGVLAEMLAGAAGADLLLTTGGASVGDHDLVQETLQAQGMKLAFWKIAMRPGKPVMFGQLGSTPVLGLPGNPVSALVCSLLFVKPAFAVMEGRAPGGETETAILGSDLKANDQRQDYLRARLGRDAEGKLVAHPLARQDSAMMAFLAQADGLVIRPPHAPAAKAGEIVPVIRFPSDLLGI